MIYFSENYGGAYIEILSAGDVTKAYICKITNINSRFSQTMY